jgi:hypothetical protein
MSDEEDQQVGGGGGAYTFDCYPYSFSPLLLFADGDYFDKGHSNYNSVAQFFSPVLRDVPMLENVIFERKNMRYEVLILPVGNSCTASS